MHVLFKYRLSWRNVLPSKLAEREKMTAEKDSGIIYFSFDSKLRDISVAHAGTQGNAGQS